MGAKRAVSTDDLVKKAESGDAEAANALGLLYEMGLISKPQPHKAKKFYEQAAAAGHPEGQDNLVSFLRDGPEETRDFSHAKKIEKDISKRILTNPGVSAKPGEKPKKSFTSKNPFQILVIEDNASIRDLLKESLKPFDIVNVMEAENGQEAVKIIVKNTQVHFIVVDLNMPKMSGIEFLRLIRRQSAFAHTPVLVISGEDLDDERQGELKFLKVLDFWQKPLNLQRWIGLVKEQVG